MAAVLHVTVLQKTGALAIRMGTSVATVHVHPLALPRQHAHTPRQHRAHLAVLAPAVLPVVVASEVVVASVAAARVAAVVAVPVVVASAAADKG